MLGLIYKYTFICHSQQYEGYYFSTYCTSRSTCNSESLQLQYCTVDLCMLGLTSRSFLELTHSYRVHIGSWSSMHSYKLYHDVAAKRTRTEHIKLIYATTLERSSEAPSKCTNFSFLHSPGTRPFVIVFLSDSLQTNKH